MKRLTGSILALMMVCCVLAVPAGAAAPHHFYDVPPGHWAWEGVQYVYENGIMKGTSDDTFSPDSPFSRAMFVTILGRAEGVNPEAYPGASFRDVAEPRWDWAAPYIQWASEHGIVNGVGDGRFAPDSTITREQYCTIILRYMDAVGLDFVGSPVLAPGFRDVYSIQSYALPHVMRMAGYGLLDSYGGYVYPDVEMTRGDIADLFSRFHRMISTGSLPDVYSLRTDPYITFNEVAALLVETSIFTWDWFYGGTYLDPDGRVIYPDVHRWADLKELTTKHYTSKVWDLLDSGMTREETGAGLYLPVMSLDFAALDSCALDIWPIEEDRFAVTMILYLGEEETARVETTCVYQDGYWVFTDSVPVMLDVVPLAFG